MKENRRFSIPLLLYALIAVTSGCTQLSLVSHDANEVTSQTSTDILRFGEGSFDDGPKPNSESRLNLQLVKAQLAVTSGQLEQAALTLESILEQHPQNSEACHKYAVLKIQLSEFEDADRYFQRAIEADPRNPSINNDYGYYCYLMNRWETAERFMVKAIALDPNLLEARTNLGILHARLGHIVTARQHFEDAGCSEKEILNNLAFAQKTNIDNPDGTHSTRQKLSTPILPETLSPQKLASNSLVKDTKIVPIAGHRF